MIKICIVSVCDIAIPSRSTGWRPAPTRTVSYAGKLKHWSAPTSKSLNPFQLPALHVTEIITSLAHILISHLLLRDEFSVINDTCYVNGAVLIVWQVSAAAAALAAGGGGRKGPAVLQGDGHPDLHMPHGEHLLNQRSAVCVCVWVRMSTNRSTAVCVQVVVLCFSVFLGSFYQGLSPCSSITKTDLSREISIQDSYTTTGMHAGIAVQKYNETRNF